MPTQRTVDAAAQIVADATDQVIKDGGTIHEDTLWDANEMPFGGVPTDIIVRTISDG